MRSLQWTTTHAVFIPEIDDEHTEIFEAVTELQQALSDGKSKTELRKLAQHIATCAAGHFAHEERLMRAARLSCLKWHKQLHDAPLRQVGAFIAQIEKGDRKAGTALGEYLTRWLHDHTRLADQMMAATLRNHRRCLGKVRFEAGTRPFDSCNWVDSKGERFRPDR